ncbi:MAG: hypothetical protein A2511_10010 [Deltaproteobacteria bacterium RIFOXYD12_FULL_50_9]|nr:MAG: hypothetical protein A2511_10010 [Deltaproteobacteria bacterium RIFOXYD12_FULL_50_9]
MIVAAVGLTVVVVNTIQQALAIVETLQEGGEVPLDTQLLAGLLSKSASGSEGTVLDIATYAIILCWIIGVFDSYRVGKSQDASDDINRT